MHSSPSLDSAIHDGDSDTESHPRNPTRRRSKRRRKVIGKAAEAALEAEQFDSGQALGGHKKVHYYNNLTHNARNVSSPSTNFVDNLVIDLNLPAPEEEDGELSQLEFSTVSD
ncbi:zinc finger protein ZAT9 [Prunus yedoensis var. nudiflora]|uniref:Zinc finger protein ZAT9 n=1 Tax=Prunus yedoensis var. nudiflora TaxID=2094558 RepID=A0A314YD34_PRUYE|nr:zinc finger protein ZAT9 [Prunus yedoensis var. nudiflora]